MTLNTRQDSFNVAIDISFGIFVDDISGESNFLPRSISRAIHISILGHLASLNNADAHGMTNMCVLATVRRAFNA